MDLSSAVGVALYALSSAYNARGITQVDPEEFQETIGDMVGGICAYILQYVKLRERPAIEGQSSVMRLAQRLSNVFNSVEEAALALHEVERIVLELIDNALHSVPHWDVVDFNMNANMLIIFVRTVPAGLIGHQPGI